MRMAYKAAANRAFERLPGGRMLRRIVQAPMLRPVIRMPAYRWHYDAATRWGGFALEDAAVYEFGAGKELACPIVLWCYGVPRQLIVDREPLLDRSLVARAMRMIARLDEPLFRRRPGNGLSLHEMGIEYMAPVDARSVPWPEGSIDLIVSNSTLEHIPSDDIAAIMRECRRLCSPRGVVSLAINYADHYAGGDASIGVTHFLRYSDDEYERFQSSFLYQNRLRHSDYRRIFEETGFSVLDEFVVVTPEDVEAVSKGPIADRFHGYALEDLAARHGRFALTPVH